MSKSRICPHCGKDPCNCTNNKQNENKFFNRNVFHPTLKVDVDVPLEKRNRIKKKCECSSKVNIQDTFLFNANICPKCRIHDSTVSFAFGNITFNSTTVVLPQCMTTDNGAKLITAGNGTLAAFSEEFQIIIQGTFTLALEKNIVFNDMLLDLISLTVTGFDQNGNTVFLLLLILLVPNEDFIISLCDHCPPYSPKMNNQTSNINNHHKQISKGKIIMMKNGQIVIDTRL
ncbi:hypothetical protein [Bacillus sp. JJ1474]|uniref:hypothetical protein n=1 Tax=Bacillus sp. JJ1474 TaxID=3122955 RepID=UPI002FFDECE8